ncbi:MAG: cupin domain-containing protein [Anaerolineae bacterium]|nr:cupin domain-containing protein [Anaerolineae bacterium]
MAGGTGLPQRRLLSADSCASRALLQSSRRPAGQPRRPHRHAASVEVYVVTRGVCELIVNGQAHETRPDICHLMEPEDVHELTNQGLEAFELLVMNERGAQVI